MSDDTHARRIAKQLRMLNEECDREEYDDE